MHRCKGVLSIVTHNIYSDVILNALPENIFYSINFGLECTVPRVCAICTVSALGVLNIKRACA